MSEAQAHAKINLALVVGPRRPDGKHEVATVLQRVDLADQIAARAGARASRSSGFAEDTLVRDALLALAAAAGVEPSWTVQIEKRIPVAAGLGGGSSDAAAALRLANETLTEPLPHERLHALAAGIGADVPFFLTEGPQLGTGDGTDLEPVELPHDYWVVLVLPTEAEKASTAAVYEAFDGRRRIRRPATRSSHAALAAARPGGASARTTSPPRRSPTSSARSAPSARTSPAPARPSTASSPTGSAPKRRAWPSRPGGAPGSTAPAWYG